MNTSALAAPRWLWAVLVAGVGFVTLYDVALGPARYPYVADSASYVEMADTLYHSGRPRVTPWEIEPTDRDQIPQLLFPPGFALVIAAVMPFAPDAAHAALWPSRIAAALLPWLILLLFRGLVSDRALALAALYALATPGVRGWQFIAYSDVTAVAVAVVALGALARGQGLIGAAEAPARRWLVLAGLAAGCAYGIRNAGLAVLAACVLSLVVQRLRARTTAPTVRWWLLGAALPLAALLAYNLATFGRVQPYTMPASRRPWFSNLDDYAHAQLTDLGVPWELTEQMPAWLAVLAIGVVVVAVGVGWHALRRNARHQAQVTLLGGYALGGALLLIASRSRYEWGGLIDVRNTLQYTWALGLVAVVLASTLLPATARRGGAVAGALLLAFLVVGTVREIVGVRAGGPEVWQVLARDRELLAAAARLPRAMLVASNQSVLFRIGARRPVRQLEISGSDRDFANSLRQLARVAQPRPTALLLVCDDYTRGYSACGGPPDPATPAPACSPVRSAPPRVWLCRPATRS